MLVNKKFIPAEAVIPVVLIVVLLAFTFLNNSCKKTSPANAIILVIDSTGMVVPGATVVMRNDSVQHPTTGAQAIIYQEKITDLSGRASFSFKWEAVLFVTATKGTLSKRDYIRLEQSKTVEKTLMLE